MSQMSSHVEYEHDLFIKRVSCVNLNLIKTRLTSIYDLFINGLAALDFATPTCDHSLVS